ncbi:MAG: ABC transporter ATP-binding protein, partial [Rhodococcus sp. (in: high G+C Gram-positive bacteria)]
CVYQARCPIARDICISTRPPLESVGNGRMSACHFPNEVSSHV